MNFDQHFDQINKASKAILEDLKARFKAGDKSVQPNSRWSSPYGEEDRGNNFFSGVGRIDCPVCGKSKLNYRRSSYNGHVHANCENPDCVRWMEQRRTE